jgi:hypothetical protein
VLSNYLAGALLEASVGKTPTSISAPVFLALLAARATAEDDGSTLEEVSYGGYSRTALAGSVWAPLSGLPRLTNATPISLPTRTSGSAQAVAWAITDDADAGEGNVLHYGDLPGLVIDADDPSPVIPEGLLVIAFASPAR